MPKKRKKLNLTISPCSGITKTPFFAYQLDDASWMPIMYLKKHKNCPQEIYGAVLKHFGFKEKII